MSSLSFSFGFFELEKLTSLFYVKCVESIFYRSIAHFTQHHLLSNSYSSILFIRFVMKLFIYVLIYFWHFHSVSLASISVFNSTIW